MRKSFYHIAALLIAALPAFTSCEDFLDKEASNELTGKQTFSSWTTMEQFHIDTYNFLLSGECRVGSSWLDAATDLAETSIATSGARTGFNIGNYYSDAAAAELTSLWESRYRGIRKCNMLLERIDSVPKAADDSYELYETHKNWYKGEARFMRAYFYWELFLRYGPVPLVTKTLDPDGDLLTGYTERPSVKDYVVNFVIPEIKAAEQLVMDKASSDLAGYQGRINKDICRGMLTRIYLYMASPRYSAESGITWQDAADMCKSFIDDYGSHYRLMPDYGNAILSTTFSQGNTETIFFRSDVSQGWSSYGFSTDTPVGEGGNGGNCPSQNLVDMYDMADGSAPFSSYDATGAPVYTNGTPSVDAASGYDDAHPFAGRDPRLKATVLCNGDIWNGRAINVVAGMADNPRGNANATPTGYYMRKYMPEAILQNIHTGTAYRNWIIMRYAEVLLNYAEALSEANFTGNYATVCNILDTIRHRAGITGNVAERPDLASPEAMRAFIHKERTVELAFEEHRPWDVRRWNVAVEALSRPVYGINVAADGTCTRKVAQNRVFSERMYLYPIPETETWKTNIANNPGWGNN